MKKSILQVILGSIFLVIFNVLFFVLGGIEHNASVWLSYGFIHFAYFMLLLTSGLVRRGKSAAVFGFSLHLISMVYFFIALVIGVIFIFFAMDSYTVTLLVQLCLTGVYGVFLVSHMIANEHTADAEEKRQYQIAYVKDASAKLKSLCERVSDKEVKKKVEKVYDAIYSSPVKSYPNLAQIENNILHSINKLEEAISTGNTENILSLVNSLLEAINERNRQLKLLN
jgi:hypothetical protein